MNADKKGKLLDFHLLPSAIENLNLTVLGVSPDTVRSCIENEEFREIKTQMDADERRSRGLIFGFPSASIRGRKS